MACGGSSIHHDHQEEDVKQMEVIINSLDCIEDTMWKFGLLNDPDGYILNWEMLHLKDVIATKHALQRQRERATSPVELRIASWNLKKATLKGKHPDKIETIIHTTIAGINPDIIALQEIASSKPSELLKDICVRLNKLWEFSGF